MRANEKKTPVFFLSGKFKMPIGGNAKSGEARQTIAEMATQLLELEGEHIEVVQNTASGRRGIISDTELDMLLDRRKEVFEGRGVGWKSGAPAASVKNRSGSGVAGDRATAAAAMVTAASPGRRAKKSDLFEVYEAPKDEGNDALAHMLGEEVAA
jgi:ATP-dependent DNA helicase